MKSVNKIWQKVSIIFTRTLFAPTFVTCYYPGGGDVWVGGISNRVNDCDFQPTIDPKFGTERKKVDTVIRVMVLTV